MAARRAIAAPQHAHAAMLLEHLETPQWCGFAARKPIASGAAQQLRPGSQRLALPAPGGQKKCH